MVPSTVPGTEQIFSTYLVSVSMTLYQNTFNALALKDWKLASFSFAGLPLSWGSDPWYGHGQVGHSGH